MEEVSARFETELQYLNSFLNRIATLRQSFDEQRLMYRACLTRMSTAGTSASSLGSISAGTASSGSGSDETGTYARSLHRLERKKVLVPDKKMASSQFCDSLTSSPLSVAFMIMYMRSNTLTLQ